MRRLEKKMSKIENSDSESDKSDSSGIRIHNSHVNYYEDMPLKLSINGADVALCKILQSKVNRNIHNKKDM